MKKIMLLIASLSEGGAEGVLAILANHLVQKGYEIFIVTVFSDEQEYALDSKIKVILLDKALRPKNKLQLYKTRLSHVRKSLQQHKPDVVISFLDEVSVCAMLANIGTNIPVIAAIRNDPNSNPEKMVFRILRNFLFKHADGIVCQTTDGEQYVADKISKKFPTTVIANPLKKDLPIYQKRSNDYIAIAACRIEKQKNLPMMIDAIEMVRQRGIPCCLNVFGRGNQRQEIQQYICNKGLQGVVILHDFSRTIHEEMLKSDVFLLSSDYEGMSNSMLEALAIGIPTVVTDCPVGAGRMFITPQQTGCLTPVGDATAFADAVERVLQNKQQAFEMGCRARSIRGILAEEQIVEQWENFIEKVGVLKYGTTE